MTLPYKNDIGYDLHVALSFDLTDAVAAYMDVRRPGSTTSITWTCEATGYDNTTLYYITKSSSDGYFDATGNWSIQPRVVFGAASSVSVHDTLKFIAVGDPM